MAKIVSTVASAADIKSVIEECRREDRPRDFKLEGEPGLWVRVSAKGIAAWSLVYKVKGQKSVQRYGLGRFPDTSVKDAREMAAAWRPRISQGIDPREALREQHEKAQQGREAAQREAEAKAARITVAQAVESFLVAKHKNRSVRFMKWNLDTNLVAYYGTKALADLSRKDIEAIQEAMVKRGALRHSDNVLGTVRSLLSWAVKRRHVTENVAARFERQVKDGEGIRERKLTAAEVKALWLLLDRDDLKVTLPVRRILKLGVLLGQRAGEIAGMRAGELTPDLLHWDIPAERMKAKRRHIVPLPPMAREIIPEALADAKAAAEKRGEKVVHLFAPKSGKPLRSSSVAHAMVKLNEELALTDVHGKPSPVKSHDLRRTMATGMQHLGTSIDVVNVVLAHTSAGDVTVAHYAQSQMGMEAREALTKWQGAVTQMVRGHDPFELRAEDIEELERRILGQDKAVTPERPMASDVRQLRAAG